MKSYVLKGIERLTGEFNGRTYDTFRFNFVSRSRWGIGSIPFVVGGKLPSLKASEMGDYFDCFDSFDLDKSDFGIGDLLGRSFKVFVDKYGRIQGLYEAS